MRTCVNCGCEVVSAHNTASECLRALQKEQASLDRRLRRVSDMIAEEKRQHETYLSKIKKENEQ